MITKTIYVCEKCGWECADGEHISHSHYTGDIPLKLCKGEVVPVVWLRKDELRKELRKMLHTIKIDCLDCGNSNCQNSDHTFTYDQFLLWREVEERFFSPEITSPNERREKLKVGISKESGAKEDLVHSGDRMEGKATSKRSSSPKRTSLALPKKRGKTKRYNINYSLIFGVERIKRMKKVII